MPQPGRDIRWTLLIKFSLFFLLWFFFIKGTKPPNLPRDQWLLGSHKNIQMHPLKNSSRIPKPNSYYVSPALCAK